MKVLVLGGTRLVSRAFGEVAAHAGHEVTTFHRGLAGPGIPGVEWIRGDREGDLSALDRPFDLVVETLWRPELIEAAHRVIRAERAIYVSSVSVYREGRALTEEAALATDGEYPLKKIASEDAMREVYGARLTIVRPGVILGPYEDVGRLTWWLRRIAAGGRVLAPGNPGDPIQLVDARDLAAFSFDAPAGVFNVVRDTSMGAMLEACVHATSSNAELVWTPEEKLASVEPWNELPLWVRRDDASIYSVTCRREVGGRSMFETARDTWAWLRTIDGIPRKTGAAMTGLDPEKEARILTS